MSKLFLLLCLFLSACAASSPNVDSLDNGTASQLNTIQMQNYELQALVVGLDSKLNDIEKRMQLLENSNLPTGKVIPTPSKNAEATSSSNIMRPNSFTDLAPSSTSTSLENTTNTSKTEKNVNVVEPKTNSQNTTSSGATPKLDSTSSSPNSVANTTTNTNPAENTTTDKTTTQTASTINNTTTPILATNQPKTVEQKAPTPLNQEQAAYAMALKLYQAGRYAEADAAFTAFDQTFPTSNLLANSIYWRGETFYARRDFPQAILIFKEVQTRFPNTEKAADSLLKTALAYDRIGDPDNALLNYNALIEDYPTSEALKRAKQLRLVP